MANVHARELRKNLTDAEQRLWQKLKRRQIATVKFRRQQPIGPFIVDFVCFERRLIIEVDGGQHAEQAAYDEERTQWLKIQGYSVLRFWNNEVIHNLNGVLETVAQALSAPLPPTPDPSPPLRGGRGDGTAEV